MSAKERAKELRRAAKLGIEINWVGHDEYEFDVVCPSGPW